MRSSLTSAAEILCASIRVSILIFAARCMRGPPTACVHDLRRITAQHQIFLQIVRSGAVCRQEVAQPGRIEEGGRVDPEFRAGSQRLANEDCMKMQSGSAGPFRVRIGEANIFYARYIDREARPENGGPSHNRSAPHHKICVDSPPLARGI